MLGERRDFVELLGRRQPVGALRRRPRQQLALESGDAHHEEFIEIVGRRSRRTACARAAGGWRCPPPPAPRMLNCSQLTSRLTYRAGSGFRRPRCPVVLASSGNDLAHLIHRRRPSRSISSCATPRSAQGSRGDAAGDGAAGTKRQAVGEVGESHHLLRRAFHARHEVGHHVGLDLDLAIPEQFYEHLRQLDIIAQRQGEVLRRCGPTGAEIIGR